MVFALEGLNDGRSGIGTQLLQVVVCLSIGSSTCMFYKLDRLLVACQQTDLRLYELAYILVRSLGSSGTESVQNGLLILGISRSEVGNTVDGVFHKAVLGLLGGLHHTNQDFDGLRSSLGNVLHLAVEVGLVLQRHQCQCILHNGLCGSLSCILCKGRSRGDRQHQYGQQQYIKYLFHFF